MCFWYCLSPSLCLLSLVLLSDKYHFFWESLWGAEDQGFDEADFCTGEEPVVPRGDSGNQELSVRVQVATKIKKFVAVCYPWIHASSEGNFQIYVEHGLYNS